MTAEDRCKVFKDLLLWAWRHEGEVLYMEERVYAVSNGKSVTLVIAGDPKEAKDKVRELGYEHGKRDGADPPLEFIEDEDKLTKEQFDNLFDSGWRK